MIVVASTNSTALATNAGRAATARVPTSIQLLHRGVVGQRLVEGRRRRLRAVRGSRAREDSVAQRRTRRRAVDDPAPGLPRFALRLEIRPQRLGGLLAPF